MKQLITDIRQNIEPYFTAVPEVEGIYKAALKAALAKSFEFTELWVNQPEESELNGYFHLGSLRGICEDYIVLSFYLGLDETHRNEAIKAYTEIKMAEAIQRQSKYFKPNRPTQPIIESEKCSEIIANNKNSLKEIGRQSGLWQPNNATPKILWMAKALDLEDFYQFFYGLTSETVHFNPRVLLRMGWGDKEILKVFKYSTTNFSGYYQDFAITYSVVLLHRYLTTFDEALNLTRELKEQNKLLEEKLNSLLRWPELVTFEEMNQKSPSQFIRVLMNSMGNQT